MARNHTRYTYPSPEKFNRYRLIAFGWDRQICADFLFCSERTIREWEAARRPIPYTAYRLVKLKADGRILDDEWEGWTCRGQSLFSPVNREYKSTELSYLDLFLTAARGYLFKAKHKKHFDAVEKHGETLDEVNALFNRLRKNAKAVFDQR